MNIKREDCRRPILSPSFYLSLNIKDRATSNLSEIQKLVQPHSAFHCDAQFNFQAFQHSRLWQQTTTVLRPQLLRKHTLSKRKNKKNHLIALEHLNSRVTWSHMIFTLSVATNSPHTTPVYTAASSAHLWRRLHRGCKGWWSSAAWQSYCSLSFTILRRHSTRVRLSFLLLSSRRDGLIQVNGAVSDWPELHRWTLFPEKSLCIFRRSGGSDYCSEAGRQRCSSAKCSSCLPLLPFSLTRCREQESRPRFFD